MDLQTQLITLGFSFLYGFFFSLFLGLNYKIIYHDNKYIKFIGTFLVVLIGVLFYFVLLRQINYGVFHPYEILMIILGVALECGIAKHFKK